MNWTLSANEPGSLLPGDFRLSHDGHALIAGLVLRTPSAGFPDVANKTTADIRAEVEAGGQRSKHRRQIAELEQKAGELRNRLNTIDKKLKDLAARRQDPSLLDMDDLAGEVQRMESEENTLRQQRTATGKALEVLQPHMQRASTALAGEMLAEARNVIQLRRQAALDRRRELLGKLASTIGPILDELVQAEAEIAPLLAPDVALERLGLAGGEAQVLTLAGPM